MSDIQTETNSSTDKLQNYYFIMYFSNPAKELVTTYIDGEETPLILTHSEFLKIIRETINNSIITQVAATLATYGTHYLLDRDALTISRVSVKNGIEESSVSRLSNHRKQVQVETSRGGSIDSTIQSLAYSSLDISSKSPTISFKK